MKTCLVPDCDSTTLHLRGLCRSCYLFAASLVFHKITTWGRLEAAKCVLPLVGRKQSLQRPVRVEFFARGVNMSADMLQEELRSRASEYVKHLRSGATKRPLRKKGKTSDSPAEI